TSFVRNIGPGNDVGQSGVHPGVGVEIVDIEVGELLPGVVERFGELLAWISANGGEDKRHFFAAELLLFFRRGRRPDGAFGPEELVVVAGEMIDALAEDELRLRAVGLEIVATGTVAENAGQKVGRTARVEDGLAVKVGIEGDLRHRGDDEDCSDFSDGTGVAAKRLEE